VTNKKYIETVISTSKKNTNDILHHSSSYHTKLFYLLLVNGQVSSMIKTYMSIEASCIFVYLNFFFFFFVLVFVCSVLSSFFSLYLYIHLPIPSFFLSLSIYPQNSSFEKSPCQHKTNTYYLFIFLFL
jgi:hypothetical protein